MPAFPFKITFNDNLHPTEKQMGPEFNVHFESKTTISTGVNFSTEFVQMYLGRSKYLIPREMA